MTNNNEDNNEDNDEEIRALQDSPEYDLELEDEDEDIELGDEDERPFTDSDEAIRALQDVAESVDELEAECHRLRDENKLLRAERVEAERTILRLESQYGVAVKDRDEARKTCCRLWQKEDSGYITVQRLAEDQGWDCFQPECWHVSTSSAPASTCGLVAMTSA